MFKLRKNLTKRDWFFVGLILGLTVLQVYLTRTLMDSIELITKQINYLNYNQNPADFFAAREQSGRQGASALYNPETFSWDGLLESLKKLGNNSQTDASVSALLAMLSTINDIATITTGALWVSAGRMILEAFGLVATQVVISFFASSIAARVATKIRSSLNEKVSSFSLAEINKYSTASLITRTTNDVQQLERTYLLILRRFFSAPITLIWAICKIQSVSWTLMVPTIIGVVFRIAFLVRVRVFVRPKFRLTQKLLDKRNGITRENLNGIRVVRAYNGEQYQEYKFSSTNKERTKVQLFTGSVRSLRSPLLTLVRNGISLAIYWIGAYGINKGNISYPQILSMMRLSTQIIRSFRRLLFRFFRIPRANVSAKRINEILETTNSIKDPEVEKPLTEKGSLEFKDVSFRYPDAKENRLEHISFQVKEGETLAIIGRTGSGKSTIANLIGRIYDATEGEVVVDGVNVKDRKQKTLHSLIGFVPQKGLLFSGTVKDNIRLGNSSLTEEERKEAAKVACADEFIEKMEKGYDSPIAQGGSNVSGGQRQRLCIARAVAVHPQFFVFDDSFSALDFKTDSLVRQNLKAEAKDATKIIVAQRIGTIRDADHIVVLEEGKRIGYGTHKELLNSCPTYRSIALSQLSKEELGL